jgi:hypothetical protein
MFYKVDSDDASWFPSRSIRKAKEHYFKEGKAWQVRGYGVLLEDCFQNPTQVHLNAFAQLPDEDNLRGAETYLCETLAKERHGMKSRVLQAVVDREIELKLDGSMTADELAAELRLVSEKHSKWAKEFALKMGEADEAAIRDDAGCCIALDLVRRLSGKDNCTSSLSASVINLGNDWLLSSVKNMIVGRQA